MSSISFLVTLFLPIGTSTITAGTSASVEGIPVKGIPVETGAGTPGESLFAGISVTSFAAVSGSSFSYEV